MSIYSKVEKLQLVRAELAKVTELKRELTSRVDGAKTEIIEAMKKDHDQQKVVYGDMSFRRAIKKTIRITDEDKIFSSVAESEKKNFKKEVYDTDKMMLMIEGIYTVEKRMPEGAELKETEYLEVRKKKEEK